MHRSMDTTAQVIVFDAADIAAESAFWAGVLGGEVEEPEDHWHTVTLDGVPRISVQYAPDHVPPDWPANTVPQQIHMDLWVRDLDVAHAQVMDLGARLLLDAEQASAPGETWQVYADPAGHPFCLCLHP